MKRLFVLAILAILAINGSVLADPIGSYNNPWAIVSGTVTASNGSPSSVRGYLADYDMFIATGGVTASQFPVGEAQTALENKTHQVFCIDPTAGFTSPYRMVDLDKAPTVIAKASGPVTAADVANQLKRIVYWATTDLFATTNSVAKLTTFSTAGNNSNHNNSQDAAVTAVQGAVWRLLGIGGTSAASAGTTAGDWLYGKRNDGNLGANLYALISPAQQGQVAGQDFGINYTGETQFVPEPGSLVALCGLGLMLAGGAGLRRRRK